MLHFKSRRSELPSQLSYGQVQVLYQRSNEARHFQCFLRQPSSTLLRDPSICCPPSLIQAASRFTNCLMLRSTGDDLMRFLRVVTLRLQSDLAPRSRASFALLVEKMP